MKFNRWLRRQLQWVLILVLVAVSAGELAAQPVQPLDGDAIDSFVESQMQAHRIRGLALAITQGDEIVHLRGYGTAGDDRPMTADTPMHLGSVSKSFTALAIMQLVEQGQVDLDAPVQAYLPWFTVADDEAGRAITVRHLLHHTSGLSDLEYVPTFPDDTTLQQAVEDLDRVEPTAA
ncbi:MAG TPA: serine hydrolase domain-containing protein, partial [Anaerolineae bacterium]